MKWITKLLVLLVLIQSAYADPQIQPIDMQGYQINNLADGIAPNDAVNVSQLTASTITNYALEAGGNLQILAAKDFATQTTLAQIKAKTDNIPPLGQALNAASVPVVLTASQLATLTPAATVAVTQSTSPWVVSGTVGVTQSTSPWVVTGTTTVSGPISVTQGTSPWVVSGTVASTQSGAWSVGLQNIAAAAINPATEDTLVTLLKPADTLTKVTTVDTITNPVAVTGTFWQATQPVSAVSLPLPTGASTEATLTTLLKPADTLTKVTTVDTITNPVSITGSVTISGTVAATQSGTWNITNISGTISLPTGAATSALQTTGNTSLSSIATNTSNTNAKFTAAAALSDAQANPTTTRVGAALQLYNGTTWDRVRGDTTNGLDVDVTRLPALVTGSAIVGRVGIDQTTPGTTNAISLAQIGATTVATGNGVTGAGSQRVTIASDNTPFSVNATSIPSTVSSATPATGGVTTSSTTILASDGSRKAGFIQNVSDTTVWLSLGGTATAAAPSIQINPGGLYDLTTGGYCYTGAVTAIHAGSGTKNVSIVTF